MIKNTYHLNVTNVNNHVCGLKKMKIPFTLSLSNYTTTITTANEKTNYIKNELSLKTFAAGAKIKSDLRKLNFIPEIDMHQLNYYDTAITKEMNLTNAYNVDLKSAYATILFNDGFISRETFIYLNSLEKIERLAAVGMCASKKEIYDHDKKGNVTKREKEINSLAPFFFYCVKKTASIINQIRNEIIHPSHFLFSWVDGIYYSDNRHTDIIKWFIEEELNMMCSFEELRNFSVSIEKDFFFIKFDTYTSENKSFIIPIPEAHLKQQIVNHLLTKNYKTK